MTNIAIVGLGNIGQVHAANLASLRGCRVAGVFDTRAAAMEHAPPGARRYESVAQICADPAIDAIVIATPADTHRSVADVALAAGKHVFIEKPLATSLEDADAIVAAAQRSRRCVQTGFCERFNPHYLEAHRAVSAGLLGDLRSLQSSRVAPMSLGNEAWPLGALDTAAHNIDLILWLKRAMPVRVRAYGTQVYPGSDMLHAITTVMAFADGAIATDHVAWVRDTRHPLHECARSRMSVMGTLGTVEVDLTARPTALMTAEAYRHVDTVIIGAPEYYSCLKLQFEAFLRAIENGLPATPTVGDALAAERVILAAAESLQTNQEVILT